MKDRMKVYHGIPKSVPDENTIFYASFDGSVKPEISGGIIRNSLTDYLFLSTATGYGLLPSKTDSTRKSIVYALNSENSPTITLSFGVYINSNNVTHNTDLVSLSNMASSPTRSTTFLFDNKAKLLIYLNKDGVTKTITTNYVATLKTYINMRFVIYTNKIIIYINGVRFDMIDTDLITPTDLSYVEVGSGSSHPRSNISVCSDLHISNIDRGDFFPNLPQDFIEGKAIIKERFGQQQIKGDPMYSQVTELRIPPYNDSTKYLYVIDDRDRGTLINNPEATSIEFASTWGSGASFKIKGLNNEVISGVIDTDTALARVVANDSNTFWIKLDDVSKFTVNDTIRHLVTSTNSITGELTVQEINLTEKSIRVNTQQNTTVGNYIFETTASSSSPVVKTVDGQTVVGTWSGLGTNEATFTLGNNTPSLSGKDLYITYSLNIPLNNSHFPEIPYSVDKAFTDTGVEMKPVTEIVIEDDFRGKVSRSTKECSHAFKVNTGTSLLLPSSFTHEQSNESYSRIITLDNSTSSTQSTANGSIPQQLFSFNLIEIVERKLGCKIPSNNKSQWLIDNIDSVKYYHYGYGLSPSGNRFMHKFFKDNAWSGGNTNTGSSPTLYGALFKLDLPFMIQEDGFIHLMLHTDPSDGVTPSNVFTDYVSLKVILKLPPNYQALYCDNKRAREDKCNPILVQKETKTIQRLIPSKECFVTESKSGVSKSLPSSELSPHTTLTKSDFVYVTTQGTGSYNNIKDDYYRECIAKIVSNSLIKSSEITNEELGRTFAHAVKFTKVNSFSYPNNVLEIHPVDLLPNVSRKVFIKPSLLVSSGEMYLRLYLRDGVGGEIPNNVSVAYKIPNRPLIK